MALHHPMWVNVPSGARNAGHRSGRHSPGRLERRPYLLQRRLRLAPEDQSLLPRELLVGEDALLVQLAQLLQSRHV